MLFIAVFLVMGGGALILGIIGATVLLCFSEKVNTVGDFFLATFILFLIIFSLQQILFQL